MLWSRKIILGQNILLQCRIKLLQCFSIPLPEWSYFNLICILRLLLANQIPIFLAKSAWDDDCGIKPHQFGVPKQFLTKILSKKFYLYSVESKNMWKNAIFDVDGTSGQSDANRTSFYAIFYLRIGFPTQFYIRIRSKNLTF